LKREPNHLPSYQSQKRRINNPVLRCIRHTASNYLLAGLSEERTRRFSGDLPTNIAAIRRFLRACIVKPILQDDFEQILAFNMVVKPSVRGAMIQRELDCASELEGITVPVLVTHGRSDTVILPAMADYILKHCKSAQASWYDGVGHAPFLEEPLRFNTELKDFARNAHH
jgi:non-heme chloroperoxidase